MPHKHKRRGDDSANFNLPPTVKARPLPVGKQAQTVFSFDDTKQSKKRKRTQTRDNDNDTPRAFARMMYWSSTGSGVPSGLDDGAGPRKKKKARNTNPSATSDPKSATSKPSRTSSATAQVTAKASQPPGPEHPPPSILPGESLSDFSARVNAALPIAGLARKVKDAARQTRMEKKLQRGYAAWRAEEARLKEKEEEARELAEEEEEERNARFGIGGEDPGPENASDDAAARSTAGASGKVSKRKRRFIGEIVGSGASRAKDDDDPWAVLEEKRARPKGLHDVALAPPELKPVREKFKTVGGGGNGGEAAMAMVHNVPSAGKSLKQREELGETRQEIIARYRELMRKNRAS